MKHPVFLATAFGLLASLSLVSASLGSQAALYPDGEGVVARWGFDRPNGTKVVDEAGGRHDAEMNAAAYFDHVPGVFGKKTLAVLAPQAMLSGDDRGFPKAAEPITISVWFNVFKKENTGVLFCYGQSRKDCSRGIRLNGLDSLCFHYSDGSPNDLHAKIEGGVTPGQWHLAVATYDGKKICLYCDGKLIGEKESVLDTRLGGSFRMAENLFPYHSGFLGMLDEVVLLNRVATAEEIASYYQSRKKDIDRLPKQRTAPDLAELGRRRHKEQIDQLRERFGKRDFEEIVFATRQPGKDGHWYANFSYATRYGMTPQTLYGDGGKLLALNIKTGKVRTLVDDPKGGVRDPQLHYDGKKILFSYRKGGQPYYRLYEIQVDGTDLRQLTEGPYDDIEPSYLPDGGIVFGSSRAHCNVPCYYTRVAVLYRCDGDGKNIRRISANVEHENTPWPLPDGRILYQRWEYVDRSQVQFHHLWTSNPDGTGQTVFYGNMHGGGAFLDAKPIPNSGKVVMVYSPGHGRTEHTGYIEIVDPSDGPDAMQNAKRITIRAQWRDPYPIDGNTLLVAGPENHALSLMDANGTTERIFKLDDSQVKAGMWLHEPRPIRPRQRERIIPPRVQANETSGTVILQNVYIGRNMGGIKRGEIKKLLVLEILPMPVKPTRDWQQMVSYDGNTGGSFLLERILGTVPVEKDGSAYFQLPAMRPLFFVALDENDMSVKRMQSFMTVQPGESVSCVGCHEERKLTPPATRALDATRKPPQRITPISGIPDVFDYRRDIQPIFDRHCVACHGYEKTKEGGPYAGGVMLDGARGIFYNQSYAALRAKWQVADGRNGSGNRPPRSIGTSASPLMEKLDGKHCDVVLGADEKKMIHYWIESAGTYAGTYAALGQGFLISGRPVVSNEIHQRRCLSCHPQQFPIRKDDPRSHWFYNLDEPSRSVVLLAPLAKASGGWGLCRSKSEKEADADEVKSPFADKTDADYQSILAEVGKLQAALQANPRYDMPNFKPHPAYIREMKFFGIIPEDYQYQGPEDMWRIDRAYWRSLWYWPPGTDDAQRKQKKHWE